MSGPLCDIYVLAPSRSAGLALKFLDHFVPDRKPTWDPADPADVLGVSADATLEEILTFLESQPTCLYSMYWSNVQPKAPFFAILVFNDDGSLVLGLSCEEDDNLARSFLAEMEEFAGGGQGYWGVEETPAGSKTEFLQRLMLSDR